MAKVYADLPKLKKLEAAMRQVPNAVRLVLEKINELTADKRSPDE